MWYTTQNTYIQKHESKTGSEKPRKKHFQPVPAESRWDSGRYTTTGNIPARSGENAG